MMMIFFFYSHSLFELITLVLKINLFNIKLEIMTSYVMVYGQRMY